MARRIPMIIGERMMTKLAMVAFVTICALGGCAAPQVKIAPVFFPPPPENPHVQYLTGISDSTDVGENKKQGGFSLLVTGSQADVIRKLGKSYGIYARNGKIYVAESTGGAVVVIDPVKGTLDSITGAGDPRGTLKSPVNVTVDTEGYLYVADPARKDIVVFDPAGKFARSFGSDLGNYAKIVDVAISPEGDLYALDMGTGVVRVLDRMTGQEKRTVGKFDALEKSLRLPDGIAVDSAGFIYVTNIGNSKLMKYDRDGNFLTAFGGMGDHAGNMVRPKGVAVDDAGRIFEVDAGLGLVQIFNEQGRLLMYFGQSGLPQGSLNMPAGISVTKDNLDLYQKFAAPGFKLEEVIFVINQYGQEYHIPRVSIYGLGHMEGKEEPAADSKKENSEKK
ncbi:MAG TPA: hypothetical protein VI298_03095 [Geobacteraceae bacterium]